MSMEFTTAADQGQMALDYIDSALNGASNMSRRGINNRLVYPIPVTDSFSDAKAGLFFNPQNPGEAQFLRNIRKELAVLLEHPIKKYKIPTLLEMWSKMR